MVLNLLLNPISAEKRPWQMFFLGVIFSSLSIILSLVVFKSHSSLVMIFLSVLMSFPIIYNTVKYEEIKDESQAPEKTLLKEHSKALEVFMFLFLGFLIAYTLWFMFLPQEYLTVVFSAQLETITNINTIIQGNTIQAAHLKPIFFNNLRVLSICVLFSFLYGVGAMFILSWNAAVIAAAAGTFIRENLAHISNYFGIEFAARYFHIFSVGILKFMIHGFFEILAYLVAALAGGIISIAVIRHVLGSDKFEKIIFDVSDLLIISIVLLFIAAMVEVFITPRFF
ncbi:stage II sporulation protein M [Candidatus Woesearchaeota archaeon]|nr:stage II sporulation protein M [Candidatus Woesearchaeota archaeon]